MQKRDPDRSKYCHLYLVRHGETDWNVQGLLQGQMDVPLNPTGEKQAKRLKNRFRRIRFAIIFSSDLLRAKRTAEIIALEKKIAIHSSKALRERDYGRFEGKSWKNDREYLQLLKKFFQLSGKQRYNTKMHPDIESDEELMGRLIPFLREIAIGYPGKNVLVVTHGGTIRAFLKHLGWADDRTLPSGSIDNTGYIVVDCDGTDFFVRKTYGVNKIRV